MKTEIMKAMLQNVVDGKIAAKDVSPEYVEGYMAALEACYVFPFLPELIAKEAGIEE